MIHLLSTGLRSNISGGSIYNDQLCSRLNELGYKTTIHSIQNRLSAPTFEALERALSIINNIPTSNKILLDSIIISELFEYAPLIFSQRRFIGLIHLPKSLNPIFNQSPAQIRNDIQAYKALDTIIVTSDFSKELIRNKLQVNKSKIVVIEPGVGKVLEKTTYVDFPNRFLCVANLVKGKGISTILKAFSGLNNLNWKLDIFGNMDLDPTYRENVKNIISKLNLDKQVTINQPIEYSKMLLKYCEYDLLVSASTFESFGMCIAEATNSGLPWLSTEVGIVNKLKSKSIGKTFKLNSELAKELEQLMNDQNIYQQLCNKARAGKNYFKTWQHSAIQFKEMINRRNL